MATAIRTAITRTPLGAALAALVLIVLLGACSQATVDPELTAQNRDIFQAHLTELNSSGGTGTATLVASDERVRVNLDASGLLADATHLQHIHGFTDGTTSQCPTLAQDLDDDGLVNLFEGAAVYGPILIDLGPSEGAEFSYTRTFDPTPALPFEARHIIVHGVDVDGDGDLDGQKDVNGDGQIGGTDNGVLNLTEAAFELTMPALCGEIDRTNRGNGSNS